MKRSFFLLSSLTAASLAVPAMAEPPPAATLEPLPGGQFPSAQQLYQHVRRGVVAIERNGVPIAIGTVLGGDGRILTALSGLGGGDTADVRYADGTLVHTKVGHSDRESDLALLVPQSGNWKDGLSASDADPTSAEVRAILPFHGERFAPIVADFKGLTDAHTREGDALGRVFDVGLHAPPIPGAPLLDSTGNVVAVLVRACKGPAPDAATADSPWAQWAGQQVAKIAPCTPVVVGAPVSAIRSFLVKTPVSAIAPPPFLGVRGEGETTGPAHGVRVTAIAPSSPAEVSGLKPNGDVIVAIDGLPVETPETLAASIGKHAVGETVKLLVLGQDRFREVAVVLRAAPGQPAQAPVPAPAAAVSTPYNTP